MTAVAGNRRGWKNVSAPLLQLRTLFDETLLERVPQSAAQHNPDKVGWPLVPVLCVLRSEGPASNKIAHCDALCVRGYSGTRTRLPSVSAEVLPVTVILR